MQPLNWDNMNTHDDSSNLTLEVVQNRLRPDMSAISCFVLPLPLSCSLNDIITELHEPDVRIKENYIIGQSEEEIRCATNLRLALCNCDESLQYTYLCRCIVGVRRGDHTYPVYKTGNITKQLQINMSNIENFCRDCMSLLNSIHSNNYLALNIRKGNFALNTVTHKFVLSNFEMIMTMDDFKNSSIMLSNTVISPVHFLIEMVKSGGQVLTYDEDKANFERFFNMFSEKFRCKPFIDMANMVLIAFNNLNNSSKYHDYYDVLFNKLLEIKDGNIVKNTNSIFDNLCVIDTFALGILIMNFCNVKTAEDIVNLPEFVRNTLFECILFKDKVEKKDKDKKRIIKINNQERIVRTDKDGDFVIFKGQKIYQ